MRFHIGTLPKSGEAVGVVMLENTKKNFFTNNHKKFLTLKTSLILKFQIRVLVRDLSKNFVQVFTTSCRTFLNFHIVASTKSRYLVLVMIYRVNDQCSVINLARVGIGFD